MKNISLSIVYENSQKRAGGYMEEALRLGKVVSSWLEISDDNYQDLENRFALGEKRKVQQEVVQQEVVQQAHVAPNNRQNRMRGN